MNSNDKWQEILDEYGTYEAFLQNHRATHGEMMRSEPTTWKEIILHIIMSHDASSSSEILDKLEELYSPPVRLT
jgi:hypothetical protein